MHKIRVLLADDHAIFRAGLAALLNAEPDIAVIGEAANGEEALLQCLKLCPDLVVMDVTMPGLSGLEATRQMKRQSPHVKILALTMHEERGYLYQMLRAGADGYLPKKATDTDLIEAIRTTYRGEHYVHPSMTAGLIAKVRQDAFAEEPGEDILSERETAVLRLVAAGYTEQEIADKLYLSGNTVKTYKARIKEKLGLKRRAHFLRYAAERGLLSIDA